MNISFKTMWTLSNILSISRMVMAPFMYVFIFYGYPKSWVYSLAFLAYVSDLLDGYAARSRNEITEWGKVLDPLADKIFVGVTSIALVEVGQLSFWYIAVVIGRDLLIMIAGLIYARKANFVLPSTFIGKSTVFWIGMVLFAAFFQVNADILKILYVISSSLIAFSLFHYGNRMFISIRNS